MICDKGAQYKLFWVGKARTLGREDIFLAQEWVDKVIDIG